MKSIVGTINLAVSRILHYNLCKPVQIKTNERKVNSMDQKEMRFEDFLNDISPEYIDYVSEIHDLLLQHSCIIKMQLAKSGHVVSYSDPKTKKVVANFVSRKKGPVIRIYGDHSSKYMELLEALPEGMIKSIEKSSACRRLIDPVKCNSRCPMGYTLTVKGIRHQKCRYNCFMFEINTQNSASIMSLLVKELRERAA